ncbi:hypothetical protein PUNSTDRAFT_117288, partial [Punctularia strigosozonata HHB-11173 SS5]|uniref:uncharacterized protein n=1 Tax=Punctularia strigosozonata (strain HHB-11173) TaxID=741275 RepID=UPI00044162A0
MSFRCLSSTTHAQDRQSEYDEFFRCTTQRWIWNEARQLAMRYKPFNVSALKRVACDATGAKTCTSMIKFAEGSFNKIFLLKFDNGEECIARIPCPGAGSDRLLISSEVATLDFAHRHLGISTVPKILAWSADGDGSEVGSSYMIMEKLPGVPLSDRWYSLTAKEAWDVMDSTIQMEKTMRCVQFSQIGSLYFKEDVSEELQSRRLYASDVPDDDASDRYRIGPTVEYDFWRGERKNLNIDRGPWSDVYSYAVAVAEREKLWLSSFTPDRSAHLKGPYASRDAHLQLLDDFLATILNVDIPAHF